MSQASANGAARATEDPLSSLAARLPDAQDREWYAALVTYIHSLPPDDELVKVAQLFGFLTLIGRQLPDAIAAEQTKLREFLLKAYGALQQEVKTNASYHEKLNERLSRLPEEIASGVKPEAIAKSMSESFRQQLTQTGLQDTGRLLNNAVKELRQVAGELDAVVQPLQNRYHTIAGAIETEVGKIENAASQLRYQTANMLAQTREDRWAIKVLFCALLLLAGLVLGVMWEKRSTEAMILDLQSQIGQLQETVKTLSTPLRSPAATSKRQKTER